MEIPAVYFNNRSEDTNLPYLQNAQIRHATVGGIYTCTLLAPELFFFNLAHPVYKM